MNEDSQVLRVLIIDDEEDILEFLSYNLRNDGHEVRTAHSAQKGLKTARKFVPHIVILDIMMTDMNGIEVCRVFRKDPILKDVLIAFLTARNDAQIHVEALESGGDDFITKPIQPNVLRSKIRALARRSVDLARRGHETLTLCYGALQIDGADFKVSKKGQEVNLAKKEFKLLYLLASDPGKVFKRAEILKKVWGDNVIVGDRTIDVHIRKLRKK